MKTKGSRRMKKIYKKLISGMLLAVLMVGGLTKVNAYATESYTWSSQKQPGSTTTSSTQRTMTYYAGNIYFKATTLSTNASYIAGKCEGVDITINNTNKNVLVSVVNRPTSFKIKTVKDGRTTMKFKMYVTHNASYSQNAYGAGSIYY